MIYQDNTNTKVCLDYIIKGIILMFSFDDRESFDNLVKWYTFLTENWDKRMCILL